MKSDDRVTPLFTDAVLDWRAAKSVTRQGPHAPWQDHPSPFPLIRRGSLVVKLATEMAARPTKEAAERYLQRQLRRQIDVLHQTRISARAVELEVSALERAVRARQFSLILLGRFDQS
jgi:hypothetical protein